MQLLRLSILLFAVSLVTFMLLSLSPVNILQTNIGQAALGSMSDEHIAKLESWWGIHTPPIKRYTSWLKDFLHGDAGTSLLYRRSVMSVIAQKTATSVWLLACAWVLSGVFGFVFGIIAGSHKGTVIDTFISKAALVLAGTPVFFLALLLIVVFGVWLKIFPLGLSAPIGVERAAVSFKDLVYHAFLPALTLSLSGMPAIILHTRQKMIEVLASDYVLFARSRGLSEFAITMRHGVRNVLLPALTLQFASISEVFGGSVLVEQVFSYPGLGQAAVRAGLGGDAPL
ncbi:MAG: ABC transporter permease, partial [Spirochaetia bacterium]